MFYCWKCGEDDTHTSKVVEDFTSEIVDVLKWRCECNATNVRREFHKVNVLLVLGVNRLVGELNRSNVWEAIGKYDYDWIVTTGTRGAADLAVQLAVMSGKQALISWPFKKDGQWQCVFGESPMIEVAHPEYANPKHPVYSMYWREGDYMSPVKKTIYAGDFAYNPGAGGGAGQPGGAPQTGYKT